MLHMFGFINPFFMNLNKSSDEQNGKKRKEKKKGNRILVKIVQLKQNYIFFKTQLIGFILSLTYNYYCYYYFLSKKNVLLDLSKKPSQLLGLSLSKNISQLQDLNFFVFVFVLDKNCVLKKEKENLQIIYNVKEKKKKKPDINIKILCLSKDKQRKVDKKIKILCLYKDYQRKG